MERYRFFQNTACECFPCHEGIPAGEFSCLFCYCPLYHLGEACGGEYFYTGEGYKSCSRCRIPHRPDALDRLRPGLRRTLEEVRKPKENEPCDTKESRNG